MSFESLIQYGNNGSSCEKQGKNLNYADGLNRTIKYFGNLPGPLCALCRPGRIRSLGEPRPELPTTSAPRLFATRDHHSFSFAGTHQLVMTSETEDDPFNSLLTLEDDFYKQGYDLGVSDGSRAGLIEGRLFGLEKGFEKYASMGKLHGRAVIWTGRLPTTSDTLVSVRQDASAVDTKTNEESMKPEIESVTGRARAPGLPANTRLEKHVRTLYALTEPESLSTANDEDSVSGFDERFNRAIGKFKVIEKLTDKTGSLGSPLQSLSNSYGLEPKDVKVKTDDGAIEDISDLHARH